MIQKCVFENITSQMPNLIPPYDRKTQVFLSPVQAYTMNKKASGYIKKRTQPNSMIPNWKDNKYHWSTNPSIIDLNVKVICQYCTVSNLIKKNTVDRRQGLRKSSRPTRLKDYKIKAKWFTFESLRFIYVFYRGSFFMACSQKLYRFCLVHFRECFINLN